MVILVNHFAVFQLKWFYVGVINFRHIHQVCLPIWNNLAVIGWIFMNFDISVFVKACWENSSFIKIWQGNWVLYL